MKRRWELALSNHSEKMKNYNYEITTNYITILEVLKNLRERAAPAALRSLVVHKLSLQFVHTKFVQNEALFWILNKIQLKRVKMKTFMKLSVESLFCVGMAIDQNEK